MNRPRPVLTRAGIAGAVTAVAALAGWLGYVGPAANLSAHADAIGGVIVAVLAYLPHHVAAKSAEKVVTPTADPRDDDGNPLTTVGDIVAPDDTAVDGEASDIVGPRHAA